MRVGRTVRVAVLSVFVAALAHAQGPSPTDRAQDLLKQARNSIGVGAGRTNINSLVISGTFTSVGTARRPVSTSPPNKSRAAGGTLTPQMVPTDEGGSIDIRILMPNRFRQDYTYFSPSGHPLWTRTASREADEVWLENRAAPAAEGVSVSVNPAPSADASMSRSVKFVHVRYLLALLLYTDSSFPITFTYAGRAEAPDGRADVLDGEGPDGFAVRLFLDEKTHRPLMMSYAGSSSGQTQQLRLEEYRETDGILFPHLLSRSADGRLREQLRLDRFVVNGRLDAREFRK